MYLVKILFGTIILCSTFHQHQAVFKADEQNEDVDDFLKKVIESAKFSELADKIAEKTIDKLKHEEQEMKLDKVDTSNTPEVTTVTDVAKDKKDLREDQGDRDVEESESVDRDEVTEETTVETTTAAPSTPQEGDEVLRVRGGRTTRNYKQILDKILPAINLKQDFKLNFKRFKKKTTHQDITKREKHDTNKLVLRAERDGKHHHSHFNNQANDLLSEVQNEIKFRNNVMKELNERPLATSKVERTLPTRTRSTSSSSHTPDVTPDTSNEGKREENKKDSDSSLMSDSGEEGTKREDGSEKSGETTPPDGNLSFRVEDSSPQKEATTTGVTLTTKHEDAVREVAGRVYVYERSQDYQEYHDLYDQQTTTNT